MFSKTGWFSNEEREYIKHDLLEYVRRERPELTLLAWNGNKPDKQIAFTVLHPEDTDADRKLVEELRELSLSGAPIPSLGSRLGDAFLRLNRNRRSRSK
jgi:hypothetical protein